MRHESITSYQAGPPVGSPKGFNPKRFLLLLLVGLGEIAALVLHGVSLSKVLITGYVVPLADYFPFLASATGDMGVEHVLVGLIAAGIVFMPVAIYYAFFRARIFVDADVFDDMRLASGVAVGILGLLIVMAVEAYSFYGLWLDFGNSGPFGTGKQLGELPRILFTGVTVLIAQLLAVLTALFTFNLTSKKD